MKIEQGKKKINMRTMPRTFRKAKNFLLLAIRTKYYVLFTYFSGFYSKKNLISE